MIFKSETVLLKYTESLLGKNFSEIDKWGIIADERIGTKKNSIRKVVETFYGLDSNSKSWFNNLGIQLKVLSFTRKGNDLSARERVILNTIDYSTIVHEMFEFNKVVPKKLLIIWYEFDKNKHLSKMEIKYYQLYDLSQDEEILKKDFEIIKKKVISGEADKLSEGDTLVLGAATKGRNKDDSLVSQPFSDNLAQRRAFSLKNFYMKALLRMLVGQEQPHKSISNPNGKGGINDEISAKDLLGRKNLIEELSNFFIEYSEKNSSPFYFGVFARWGMGKSTVVQMLMERIKNKHSDTTEYIVCKFDCSLFDRKDKLWIAILKQILNALSEKRLKQVFSFNFFGLFSFKIKYFCFNLWKWFKSKGWLTFGYIAIPGIFLAYYVYEFSSFPKIPKTLIPADYKEGSALITIVTTLITLLVTLIRVGVSIFKQNVLLLDKRNENSSFVQSRSEYRQLITLINKSKKKKNIKILLVLDELDRMHKDLLPDVIELIQLFKGLNTEQVIKERDKEKKRLRKNKIKQNSEKESGISFMFSFNHDVLFPIIGKEISLGDDQLLTSSYYEYKSYIQGEGKDARMNYFKLGKEFMDKYLDLSIYLEEEIDYTKLVDELFTDYINLHVDNNSFSSEKPKEDYELDLIQDELDDVDVDVEDVDEMDNSQQDLNSFTELEIKIIKNTLQKHASRVEPRKVKRLKNALILLKKLNKNDNIKDFDKYEEELAKFIMDFLEISDYQENYKPLLICSDLERKVENHIKFTDYFIHNKNRVKCT
ncbi:hypothetical protein H7K06_24465 [Priestia aryabhattai]|uniref:P-loop NTPase fold protein n=1 Tax=Priestia aryabhattai TaxID=412384 RepID=UPI001C8ED29C|nr:P-loop NTPase fold protein [Priestia aryabhattai]MBX9970688.1 hypothetical protein [Priestia aryabhattai]